MLRQRVPDHAPRFFHVSRVSTRVRWFARYRYRGVHARQLLRLMGGEYRAVAMRNEPRL